MGRRSQDAGAFDIVDSAPESVPPMGLEEEVVRVASAGLCQAGRETAAVHEIWNAIYSLNDPPQRGEAGEPSHPYPTERLNPDGSLRGPEELSQGLLLKRVGPASGRVLPGVKRKCAPEHFCAEHEDPG